MIAAYQGKSIPSRMIQFRTWLPYSHVSEIEADTGATIEAWITSFVRLKGEVMLRDSYHEGHTPGTVIDLYEVKGLTAEQQQDVWLFLLSQVGKGYDFAGLYGFLRRADRQWQSKWFCSELEFTAYLRVMVRLLERIEPHKVSPGLIVLSPLLIPVGSLVVGEDLDLLGRVSVKEIARRRMLRMPQDGLGGISIPDQGQKHECRPMQTDCSQTNKPIKPLMTPFFIPGGKLA